MHPRYSLRKPMIHQTIFDNFAKENAMELDRYRALGGRLITVGTDAHSIPQFGMGLKEAYMPVSYTHLTLPTN